MRGEWRAAAYAAAYDRVAPESFDAALSMRTLSRHPEPKRA